MFGVGPIAALAITLVCVLAYKGFKKLKSDFSRKK